MTPSRPRAILLDIMSTVVYDPIHAEIPAFFGMSLETFFAKKTPGSWVDFELGAIDEEECLRDFAADLGEFDGDDFKRTIRNAYRFVDDGMEPLLAELKMLGVELHALSNYPSWYRMIEEELALSRYLDWSFVSCDLGIRKPERQIYEIAASTLSLNPSQCVFVDDRGSNCKAAAQVGMLAVKFESSIQLRHALSYLGVPLAAPVDHLITDVEQHSG